MEEIKQYLDELMSSSIPAKGIVTWNQEDLRNHAEPHWSYVDGCMLIALLDMYRATNEERYFKFVQQYVDFFIDNDGNIHGFNIIDYSSDAINEGKVLFTLYEKTGLAKYRKAMDLLHLQLIYQPRTASGNFWHKLIYPYQIWLDGLYMVQPFYLEYEQRFNHGRRIKDIIHQFEIVERYLKDEKTGLYYHGYDETKLVFWANDNNGRSANFWTRAIGWYAMSLVDTIDLLAEYPNSRKNLVEQLQSLADSLLKFQDSTSKMFYQVTDQGKRKDNYLETSGTCAIAYTFIKGVRLGVLDGHFYQLGVEIINAVLEQKMKSTNGKLKLTGICLVAGLGGMPGQGNYKVRDGSYEYYISEPIVTDDAKGIAPLVYAYSEILLSTH